MRTILIIAVLTALYTIGLSQNPYTTSLYTIDIQTDIIYGTAIDYSGNEVTLTMDIFKPIGDENCKRPVILFLHGGAWVVESKENESMQYMAQEMAKKGWVAASINYRLGTHKNSEYNMNFLCNSSLSEPCAYICDTAEAIRANYRAMQDAKAAVRFMKQRHEIDSTDINNFFIAGESAGAFTSILVGYMDKSGEKPEVCFDIEDAPLPSTYFDESSCVSRPLVLSRPDLGSVDGNLNLGDYDAKIRGIGSFFGAVFDLSIFTENDDRPCIYLYAQGSDVIVDYQYGKLFGRIDSECYNNFLCQNYENYPYCTGNEGLRQYFESNPNLEIDYYADIIDNYEFNGNCFESGHEIDDPELRLQNMTEFFAEKIFESGNNPSTNCNTTIIKENNMLNQVYISNNITSKLFFIHKPENLNLELYYSITTQQGQTIKKAQIKNQKTAIDISHLSPGLYFVNISANQQFKTHKLIVQ